MDIKLFNTLSGGEISVNGGEPVQDNAFDTAVYISLFTDRNWLGEELGEEDGSRLYQIKKNSNKDRQLLKEYIKESLKWMIDDGISDNIEITLNGILPNSVEYDIIISQPQLDDDLIYKFSLNWENQAVNLERLK